MSEFTEGTIVQLKSGGPKMTCTGKRDHQLHLYCQWFAGSKLEQGAFPANCLVLVPEKGQKKKDE